MAKIHHKYVVLICATEEWRGTKNAFPTERIYSSVWGEWFVTKLEIGKANENVLFFHSDWGKIAAAGSTQYVIDHWSPQLLINLGTCGGFKGETKRGTVILVNRTIVYDIIDRMKDAETELSYYTTELDLSWIRNRYPQKVVLAPMLTADRDVGPQDVRDLRTRFGAIAADWESGAIANVAVRNRTKCLILRGVSDLVGEDGGEAYEGNIQLYVEGTKKVISNLITHLPRWLRLAQADQFKPTVKKFSSRRVDPLSRRKPFLDRN
jgi:adenosylhomocysteine nucleosidase